MINYNGYCAKFNTNVKPLKQVRSRSIVACFRKMYQEFQNTSPSKIIIPQVAEKYGLHIRRVYDFFNVLTALKVCSQYDRRSLSWQGQDAAIMTFMESYAEFEIESLKVSFEDLFNIGNSISLKTIGTYFMSLFFFLGVSTLPLRQVSYFFSRDVQDRRSLERRMYLVLSLLEIMGFISHTNRSGEYVLAIDPEPYIDFGMKAKFNECQKNEKAANLEFTLARFDQAYIKSLHQERQRFFSTYSVDKIYSKDASE
ncbi:hypothetical protein TRFO_37652 [Tritrichomonas foetus]|uniref:E2F/DP family winged-helix DNA-binding domain-containing protein n=1 Tax=Tritrichomonas foetus TaxID=1144522 RepID=A0A1J4JAN4_9EUKA|nr:hypothetical protein TRFO_37652 [Tritrichomonas foetus]|eukprot:OHS96216.1 hypothetical protein TRFO_37652 [Tritrichomonas foetus]